MSKNYLGWWEVNGVQGRTESQIEGLRPEAEG